MKIIYVITGLSTGGAETMLLKLLKNIDSTTFNPVVISLTTLGEIGPKIQSLNFPVYQLRMNPGLPSLIKFLKLINLIKKIKPDIVHTWMYHSDLLGGLAAKIAGTKRIIWGIRHSNISKRRNKFSRFATIKVCTILSYWLPLQILYCSNQSKNIHIKSGYNRRKYFIIPNGFDLNTFAPNLNYRNIVRKELNLETDIKLIGLIGRYDPQKNHYGFFEAATCVLKNFPKVHFLLAGSGVNVENQDIFKMINKTGYPENFHLLGKRNDVNRLMASLNILVSSSWGESFPNVIGEAMASGIPCIVTDVGDSAKIVGDTGRVVMPGDMRNLAQNIIDLLNQPKLIKNLGQNARKRVRKYFDIKNITNKYENFYLEIYNVN